MDNSLIALIFVIPVMFLWLALIVIRSAECRSRRNILPDLMLIPGKVFVFWSFRQNFLFPDIWTDDLRKNMEEEYSILRCINLGLGAAKNIVITWDFDIEKTCRLVMERDKEKLLRIKHIQNHLCIDLHFPREKYPQMPEHHSIAFSELNVFEMPYLLPAGINRNQQRLSLSRTYLTLASLLLFIGYRDKIPPCHLLLEYEDIEGFSYQARYEVNFKDFRFCKEEPGPNVLFCNAEMFIKEE